VAFIPPVFATVWVFAPPVLVVLAARDLKRSVGTGVRSRALPVIVPLLLAGLWSSFVVLALSGHIGGFGTHDITTRWADWFVVASLAALVTSVVSQVAKGKLTLASFLLLALWLGAELVA